MPKAAKSKKPRKRGPKEERLVIDPDRAEAALAALLKTKKPPKG